MRTKIGHDSEKRRRRSALATMPRSYEAFVAHGKDRSALLVPLLLGSITIFLIHLCYALSSFILYLRGGSRFVCFC